MICSRLEPTGVISKYLQASAIIGSHLGASVVNWKRLDNDFLWIFVDFHGCSWIFMILEMIVVNIIALCKSMTTTNIVPF